MPKSSKSSFSWDTLWGVAEKVLPVLEDAIPFGRTGKTVVRGIFAGILGAIRAVAGKERSWK